MFNIGDKIYTIKNKKLCEYEVVQISNFKTKSGDTVEYLVSGASGILRKVYSKTRSMLGITINTNIDNVGEFFHSKDEANKILDIIKRYC